MSHLIRISDATYEKMRREKPRGMTQVQYFDALVENQSKAMEIQKDVSEKLQIILDMLSEKNQMTFSENETSHKEKSNDVFSELFKSGGGEIL